MEKKVGIYALKHVFFIYLNYLFLTIIFTYQFILVYACNLVQFRRAEKYLHTYTFTYTYLSYKINTLSFYHRKQTFLYQPSKIGVPQFGSIFYFFIFMFLTSEHQHISTDLKNYFYLKVYR